MERKIYGRDIDSHIVTGLTFKREQTREKAWWQSETLRIRF